MMELILSAELKINLERGGRAVVAESSVGILHFLAIDSGKERYYVHLGSYFASPFPSYR